MTLYFISMVLTFSTFFKYALAVLFVTVPVIWILFSYGPEHNTNTDKWFENLKKPSYTPSKGLFSFIWIATYAIVGVAAFMIFDHIPVDKYAAISALTILAVQYILSISLVPVFFGLKDLVLTGYLISALIPLIFWTMLEFYKLSTIAFILLLPYAAWIGFLTVLSFDFITINPHNQERLRHAIKTPIDNQRLPKAHPPRISNHV